MQNFPQRSNGKPRPYAAVISHPRCSPVSGEMAVGRIKVDCSVERIRAPARLNASEEPWRSDQEESDLVSGVERPPLEVLL